LKICVVTQQVGRIFSGPGLHAFNLIQRLTRDGHEVTVIAPHDQRPPGDLPYRFVPVGKPLFSTSQARWVALSSSFGKALRHLLAEERFDLVHYTDAREALFGPSSIPRVGNVNDTYAAERRSLAYYRQYYADWPQRWAYYRSLYWVERAFLPHLDGLLANSHYTAGVIARNYHLPAQKLFVCYKSIDVDAWAQRMEGLPRAHDPQQPRILFAGTNMQRKGLSALIQAAPAILHEFPQTQFVVLGEDKAVPRLKQRCADLRVADAFHFLGWKPQNELPAFYAQSDLFVMPSLTEALGVVFLEALAAGCVPIGSNIGGVPEIIHDGENGLLVPPDSPETLAAAILRVLRDPNLARHLAANGHPSLAPFSLDAMMACTYQVYRQILLTTFHPQEEP
jgi:glycosyltransferase involved in cell wall biosynthesis